MLGHKCQVWGVIHSLVNGWQVYSGLLADHLRFVSQQSNYSNVSDHSIKTIFIHELQSAKSNGLLHVAQTRVLRSATMPLCCSCKFSLPLLVKSPASVSIMYLLLIAFFPALSWLFAHSCLPSEAVHLSRDVSSVSLQPSLVAGT